MMKISEVMEITKLTKKAINYYEDEGLIKPDINPDNNYREYSQSDVDKLIQIATLRQLDMPVKEIKKVILNPELMKDKLKQHLMNLEDESKRIEKCKCLIKLCLDTLNITDDMSEITKNLISLKESLDMDDKAKEGFIKRQLLRIFPGNFGEILIALYSPFLNEPIDTPEKEEAWLELVNRLDNIENIEYIDEMNEIYKKINAEEFEKYKDKAKKISKKWISITDSEMDDSKEHFLKNINDINESSPEIIKMLENLMITMKDINLDKYLSVLSEDYRKYKDNWVKYNKLLNVKIDEKGNIIKAE